MAATRVVLRPCRWTTCAGSSRSRTLVTARQIGHVPVPRADRPCPCPRSDPASAARDHTTVNARGPQDPLRSLAERPLDLQPGHRADQPNQVPGPPGRDNTDARARSVGPFRHRTQGGGQLCGPHAWRAGTKRLHIAVERAVDGWGRPVEKPASDRRTPRYSPLVTGFLPQPSAPPTRPVWPGRKRPGIPRRPPAPMTMTLFLHLINDQPKKARSDLGMSSPAHGKLVTR